MKALSLLGLLLVLFVVTLHSAGAEEAKHEEKEPDSALRVLDMRELEEELRELVGSQYEVREPQNGNQNQMPHRYGKVGEFLRNIARKLRNFGQGVKSGIDEKFNEYFNLKK